MDQIAPNQTPPSVESRRFAQDPGIGVDALLFGAVARALETPPKPRGNGLCDWQLKRVTRYVDEHLGEPILVRDLAALAKLSTSHFTRSFSARVGVTPRAYLIRRRMENARLLMRQPSQRLADVALQCGLADQSHLSRLFRRDTRKTPSQWRREMLAAEMGAAGQSLHHASL